QADLIRHPMIMLLHEVLEGCFAAVCETGDEEYRGYALLHEAIVIRARKELPVRHRVGGQADIQLCGSSLDNRSQRRMLRPECNYIPEIIKQDGHVEIDYGNELTGAYRRIAREVIRAEQTILLGRQGCKEDRATG